MLRDRHGAGSGTRGDVGAGGVSKKKNKDHTVLHTPTLVLASGRRPRLDGRAGRAPSAECGPHASSRRRCSPVSMRGWWGVGGWGERKDPLVLHTPTLVLRSGRRPRLEGRAARETSAECGPHAS